MASETERINEKLTIYRRGFSTRWQARVRLPSGEWHRFSTGKVDLEDAKEVALQQYYSIDFRTKNKLPPSTRKFRRVAEFAKQRMAEELVSDGGRVVFHDYITAIDKYLIPYFGKMDVASIKFKDLQAFDIWRTQKLGRQAAHSTINTHNSALNRVLDEAEQRGWITSSIRPSLINKGKSADSRGSFSEEEYKFVYTTMRTWHQSAHRQDTRETREVLRNYILILANTGVRHGTEALGLKWKNISWFEKDGDRFLSIYVSGKTGGRELIARDNTETYLDRQRAMNADLADMTFEEVIAGKIDDFVFKNRSGKLVTLFNLARSFKAFLREHDMETGSDGKSRTLYSWRHFYATSGLTKGTSTHIMSKQMGNSTQMLDRFYSKLSPKLNAELHSGRTEDKSKKNRQETDDKPPAPTTVSDQLFDLFVAKQLSEDGLLQAVCGASDYKATEAVSLRAIESFRDGLLSEAGLMQILFQGTIVMPTTFDVFFLGNLADMDTTEGNSNAENASALLGTYGGVGDPLFNQAVELSQVSGGGTYDQDNSPNNNIFTIDGGANQTFDSVATFDATITYINGTTATITAVIFQDDAGNTYWSPEIGNNSDMTAMEAGAIRSLELTAVDDQTYSGMSSNRQTWDYVTCYVAGTLISTPGGLTPIERLKIGDQVCTQDSGAQRIRWIGCSRAQGLAKLAPIRIAAHALGKNLPSHDLWVSRQHRMLLRSKVAERMFGTSEILVPAIKLVGHEGIDIVPTNAEVACYHLKLDRHEIIFAENAPSETLHLGKHAMAAMSPEAVAELRSLFPCQFEGTPVYAREVHDGRRAKKLVERHVANGKQLVDSDSLSLR